MRFIIHEQSYEIPLATGLWRYYRDDQLTGAVEKWRLTDALDGYRFLRVDLDARGAASGRSYLYHLTLDNWGNPVQLKFRLWAGNTEVIGNLLLEKDSVIVTREINGQRFEDVLTANEGYGFWYPASTGLGLMTSWPKKKSITGIGLQTETGETKSEMSPFLTQLDLRRGDYQTLEIMGQSNLVKPISMKWNNQQRTIWVDNDEWPIFMERSDGLVAVETQHIRYQRISKPSVQAAIDNSS